ncbi:MAG: cellulase family glycosylhydrolase, partial [Acidimicrobiales bacterium]|nr:cellulase family glycosylhydrolase [Acidimicrobiales bacterium]
LHRCASGPGLSTGAGSCRRHPGGTMQTYKSGACRAVIIAVLLIVNASAAPPPVAATGVASSPGPQQVVAPCDDDEPGCPGRSAAEAGAQPAVADVVDIPVPVPLPAALVPPVPVPTVFIAPAPIPVAVAPLPAPDPSGDYAPPRTEAVPPRNGSGAPGDRQGTMPAITVEGDQIMRDGQPWWFLGYNSFVWSGDCGNDDEKMTEAEVDEWFAGMRHDGHGAVRLFFYDGWDVERLDAAVESAKKHNVYLTITLDDAIGGCGENDKEAGWFADQSERDTFQNHMTDMLERYEGETAFAWFEYFNEPSYEGGDLREFYDEMGAVADTVDPDRLFASGTVAPYWLDGEDNFLDVHESPGVDIASMHEYDEGEIESNHGPGVRANSAGKPVIVGEYGITAGEGCDSSYESRAERFAQKAEAYTNTEDGYAGALAWAWQPGGGGCELGNLDSDTAGQEVLRAFR